MPPALSETPFARVVLEITPPARPRADVLLRRASALGPAVRVVNVISRPERWSSLEAAVVLREHGFDPVWHLPNRGRRMEDVDRELARAEAADVRRVLCLRGEHKAAESPDEPKIREVVARVRARLPKSAIGVTLNHHLWTARARENLWRKVDAGADFVQTQVTFDLRGLRPIAATLHARHPGVAIVPMLLPVVSPDAALRVARRLGIPLDQTLHHDLERRGAEAGWEAFARRFDEIQADPGFAGVAIMTPIDPAPDYLARLRAIVTPAATGAKS